jgi:hypothetical protein
LVKCFLYSLSDGQQDLKVDSTNDKDCIKIDVPRIRRIMGSSNFAQTSDIEELSKKWELLKKQNV